MKNKSNSNTNIFDSDDKIKLQLREEKLDIAKKLTNTCEVKAYKETFLTEKVINVPVKREELIIEKKFLNNEHCKNKDNCLEIIRIPLSEEIIDISKHKVILEDVNIYKHNFEDTKTIEEIIKKEKLFVNTTGTATVIDTDMDVKV